VVGQRKSSELDSFHWVNTLLGNLKNSIRGSYHGIKVSKYARRYLAEIQYRFNRRFDLASMVSELIQDCVDAPPCRIRNLRIAEVCR
jgi:hypothetical protein